MNGTSDAVLFDMDGTLIDSRQNAIRSVKKGLMSIDREVDESVPVPTEERITALIGVPSDQYFRRILPEHLQKYRERVEDRIGKFEQEGIRKGNVRFYDGMKSILKELAQSDLSLGLVTNAGRRYFEAHRSTLELDRYFDLLYCVDDSRSKEKEELVERFLEQREQPETVMVGDRRYDLEAARQHDLPFVGVLWGYGDREELKEADRMVESTKSLDEILPGTRTAVAKKKR